MQEYYREKMQEAQSLSKTSEGIYLSWHFAENTDKDYYLLSLIAPDGIGYKIKLRNENEAKKYLEKIKKCQHGYNIFQNGNQINIKPLDRCKVCNLAFYSQLEAKEFIDKIESRYIKCDVNNNLNGQ